MSKIVSLDEYRKQKEEQPGQPRVLEAQLVRGARLADVDCPHCDNTVAVVVLAPEVAGSMGKIVLAEIVDKGKDSA